MVLIRSDPKTRFSRKIKKGIPQGVKYFSISRSWFVQFHLKTAVSTHVTSKHTYIHWSWAILISIRQSFIEIVFGVIVVVIVEPLVLDVTSFDRGLHAARAADPLAISARPIYSVLITIVYPVLVLFVNQHHATRPVRRQIVYIWNRAQASLCVHYKKKNGYNSIQQNRITFFLKKYPLNFKLNKMKLIKLIFNTILQNGFVDCVLLYSTNVK